MKTKIISLLIIIAIAVVSCQKDENNKLAKLQEVTFGIELVEFNDLKSTPDCPTDGQGNLLIPTIAEIEINSTTYYVDVYMVSGKYYTQAFKLGVDGNPYSVSKFILWTAHPVNFPNAVMVMAMPEFNSEYAQYLTAGSKTVPFEIVVGAFTKVEIPIEVLCFQPSVYDKFGFFWFDITEIIIKEFCFFGDICANDNPWEPADFEGSPYSISPYVIAVDMPAIFQIHVFRADGVTPVPALPVGANIFSSFGDPTKTVCAKFPDLIRTYNESFKMKLFVMIPPAFNYVEFATFDVVESNIGVWSIQRNGTNALNQFNAVDFAIGTCSPFSMHIFPYPTNP